MKTILNFIAAFAMVAAPAAFAQSTVVSTNAEATAAVKAQTDIVANGNQQEKEAAIAELASLAIANPTFAALIVSTAITNMGGNGADQGLVTTLLTTVVSNFTANSGNQANLDTANAVVLAAMQAAPSLVSTIGVSAGSVLANPLQSLVTGGFLGGSLQNGFFIEPQTNANAGEETSGEENPGGFPPAS